MIELDFLVAPQIQCGTGHHVVNVTVSASPEVFADNDRYVNINLSVGKVVLESISRVVRSELAISIALIEMGNRVGMILDRDVARKNVLLNKVGMGVDNPPTV